jgi:hypothetical protein
MLGTSPSFTRVMALIALMGSALCVASAHGALAAPQAVDPQQNAVDQAPADQDDGSMPTRSKTSRHSVTSASYAAMDVERRIRTLHNKLNITAAEESDWSKVAQVMRDNESTINQLIHARHSNPDSMTAVDDLESYQEIAQAHADGLEKMVSAFQDLYGDMPADQQRNADVVFGHFEGHRDSTLNKKNTHS